MRFGGRHAGFCVTTILVAFAFACGRTSLDDDFFGAISDAATPMPDSASDLDVISPPLDDASICPQNASAAYLLSDDGRLFTLNPSTLATEDLGRLHCPTASAPWSLTVSTSGRIYAVYEDWNIYAIDPKTLACTNTPYVKNQLGLSSGTAITITPTESGERLYVYGQNHIRANELDVTDLNTFVLSNIGTVTPAPIASSYPLDIRADAFGRIFGLGPDGTLVQIDRETAKLLAQDQTSYAPMGGATWALLTWNDELYLFSEGAVSQYDLSTKKVTPKGDVGFIVVGASAAPCIH
jgi:hypothetical protein